MKLNPLTLLTESEEERLERQRTTGVIGNGLSVICIPNPEEPLVQEQRHRAVCLSRPFTACGFCRHAVFTLVFDANPEARYDLVACPRWNNGSDRIRGEEPAQYVMTEVATCEAQPFDYCSSCPSRGDLELNYSTDKTKEGWYSRYSRLRKMELDDE